jgi:RND family efflux transporter MFP subunit
MTESSHPALAQAGPAEPALDATQRRQVARRLVFTAVAIVLLLGLGAGRTLLARAANAQTLQATSAEQSKLYVKVTTVQRGDKGQTLALPGTLQGQVQAPISARAAGYLKRWTKDIGETVKQGELLAEIDTPEIDQQLSQAVAAREQAASTLALARSTAARWEGLRQQDVVSQQDLDEKRSAVTQQQANLAASEANVQRLRQMEAFKRVVAPFAGVVTRRNVDVGDLIDGQRVLYTLAQVNTLRVYVNVPQSVAQRVKPGQAVVVTQAELRGQRFAGQVVRTAGAIDTATRTMQVEVALPNADGRLLAGAYVQVALPLPAGAGLRVPTNALLIRGEGTLVAVVDAQGRVSLRKIVVGRNYGPDFEVLDGLADGERLVLNPPDGLANGQAVVVVPNAPPAAAASSAAGAAKERA